MHGKTIDGILPTRPYTLNPNSTIPTTTLNQYVYPKHPFFVISLKCWIFNIKKWFWSQKNPMHLLQKKVQMTMVV